MPQVESFGISGRGDSHNHFRELYSTWGTAPKLRSHVVLIATANREAGHNNQANEEGRGGQHGLILGAKGEWGERAVYSIEP